MAPRVPDGHVPRPRLAEIFEPARPLSLVCAPAGFGKTVAVCEWLSSRDARVGWLSLDDGDNDAARFFLHLVGAVQSVAPGCGRAFTLAAASLRDSDTAVLMESFANELHDIDERFFVVLDDYHVVRSPAVHDAVGFLVEHMPPTMHLVMTSRREPPLPLSRWRMSRRMVELGQEQLRFASAEARQFLDSSLGLALSHEQAALLEERTEGWVGGLQLAGLSLRRRADKDAFLRSFAGNDRYVMDYLTAEVLDAQGPERRRFMLRTSVLERMNASLCRAVTEQEGCAEILERLERERVFVVSLDNKREWYRYHHLFQSLLLHQLASSETESAKDCHLAASRWYEGEGAIAEAAQHGLRANDAERVAELIGTHGSRLAMGGRSKQVLRWIREIPEQTLWTDPERLRAGLWCEYARHGVVRDDWRQRLLDLAEDGDPLRDEVALFDVYEAGRDPARYAEARERAEAMSKDPRLPELVRPSPLVIAASCALALGDVRAAARDYAEAIPQLLEANHVSQFVFAAVGQQRAIALQYGPAAALGQAEASLALAAKRGWTSLPVSAGLLYGVGVFQWECGDARGAETSLERGLSLAENEPTTVRHLLCLSLARLRLWQGRADECDALLGALDAEPYIQPLFPIAPDVGIERARIDLLRGRVDAVRAFLEGRGFGAGATPDAMDRIYGQQDAGPLLVGRYLLARNEHERAISVLTTTLADALRAGRVDTAIRCRVDLAIARFVCGERREAVQQLDAAVDTALGRGLGDDEIDTAPGYHRVFADAPEGFDALARRCLSRDDDASGRRAILERASTARARDPVSQTTALSDPLTPSEARVLEHLVAGLSNKEIAKRLFISPNTLKTHIRRVYRKLGARNRADAIRLAGRSETRAE